MPSKKVDTVVRGTAALVVGLFLFAENTGTCADASSESTPIYQAPGTKRMAEILALWYRQFGKNNPYRPLSRLKQVQEQLPRIQQPEQRMAAQIEIAADLLTLGQPDEALTVLTNLQRDLQNSRFTVSPRNRRDL
jgi:hypothetical protein